MRHAPQLIRELPRTGAPWLATLAGVTRRAVVIGAGPNGLAAGIRLAEAGVAVQVLEAADRPGGAVRTEALTLPGFRHDTFSAVHPAAVASPVFARMGLERYGLEWVHPGACMAHALGGGRAIALHRDLEATAASLGADGAAWRAFASPLLERWEALRATVLSGFPPLRGTLALGPAGAARLGLVLPRSARGLAGRLFASGDSRAWLYGSAAHADAPLDGPGSAIGGVWLALLGHAVGWPSPRGGAERLTDALVAHLRALGGTLRTGAPVTRIAVERGRVTGVEVAGGEGVAADVVIADVLPHALVTLAGDALPGTYRSLLLRYRMGPATLKLDWALDGPIPWEAPELRAAGTVHAGGGEAEMLATVGASARELPARPFLLLGQQSLADPSRAPAGKHTAWAYTHGPRDGGDWAAHAERVEAQVERFAPGFRDLILARHVLSPADMEARDRNLAGGDVTGGSYRLRQLVFRPVPRLSPYRTPVRGLFLGSAASFPGGAVHGVPGDAAARAALT